MAMLRHKHMGLSRNFSEYRNFTKNTVIYPHNDMTKFQNFRNAKQLLVQGNRRMWNTLKNDKFKNSVKTYLGIKEKEWNFHNVSQIDRISSPEVHRKDIEDSMKSFGWTNDLIDAKEHQQDTGGANVRSALSKLGFNDLKSLYSTIPKADINSEKGRIHTKIFKESNKGKSPYHGIEYEDFPESKQHPEPIGYFSEDWSDIEDKKEAANRRKQLLRNEKIFEETGMTPEPIANSPDDSDWEHTAIIYHPGTHLIPQWLRAEFRQLKLKLQRHTYSRTHIDVFREKFDGQKSPFKLFDVKGRIQAKDYKLQESEVKPRVPSFKQLMQTSEEKISLNHPDLEYQLQRDNYEGNEHFVPRYMHKDHTQEDFDWGFTDKIEDSVIPQAYYGEMNPRLDPKLAVEWSDLGHESMAKINFEPKPKNKVAARIHAMVKTDGFFDHFLDNQITYWGELFVGLNQVGGEKYRPARVKAVLPWEYMIAEVFRPKEDIRDNDPIADSKGRSYATGKRKKAFAHCYVVPGTGRITVNGMNMTEYFYDMVSRDRLVRPFKVTDTMCELDAKVFVRGGGIMGKSDAAMLAIAHAVGKQYPALKPFLRKFGLLKQDIRNVEQKKTSHYKARKSYPWVKR
ncbi:unnamed protein product [Blepharisma stoltei]|uniref:Ribosomal protein S9 n=1 Tax=Blepharisma stoltei TaxID=1481888 RepID=A0AAU9K3R7_9CILI|nr:unnamed protein product [Blepharisma stoltei]